MWTAGIVMITWTALTFYVEKKGPAKQWTLGEYGRKRALIVFDPDPFYNLDEQVSLSLANGLADTGMHVTVSTVTASEVTSTNQFDLVVYCANTYNWRPDWAVTDLIEQTSLGNKAVVAITLGAGSTAASQRHLEQTILKAGGKVIASYALWLWKPNDERKLNQSNIEVANAMAKDWAYDIAKKL